MSRAVAAPPVVAGLSELSYGLKTYALHHRFGEFQLMFTRLGPGCRLPHGDEIAESAKIHDRNSKNQLEGRYESL